MLKQSFNSKFTIKLRLKNLKLLGDKHFSSISLYSPGKHEICYQYSVPDRMLKEIVTSATVIHEYHDQQRYPDIKTRFMFNIK